MKKKIIKLAKKYPLLRSFLRWARKVVNRLLYYVYMLKKVDSKLIIFESFMGRGYSDSPKAIYKYMLSDSKYKDFKYIWAFKNPEEKKQYFNHSNTKLIKYGSKEYKKYYAISKYWISNSRLPEYIVKKKNQVYIQTWHGTPLKRLGYDIKVEGGNAMNTSKQLKQKYLSDAKRYSYMVSPSEFCTEKYISAFNLKHIKKEDIVIEKGYPRNDFLNNFTEKNVAKIKKSLKLPNDKKIILYAPTWRDNQHEASIGYTYKTEVDFDYLKENLSKDYIILFRAHYFIANSFDFKKYAGFIYDVSTYDDVNDLYVISDILVTDYSSVFFDYSILKRPIIFYMYDLEDYKTKLRDFYIDLEELPGDIVETEKELIKSIAKTKQFKYNSKYKKFNEKFTYLDDGNASKRVVEECIK